MVLDIYIYRTRELSKAGSVTVAGDRIVKIDLDGIATGNRPLTREIESPYEMARLSKNDLAYRDFRLTHKLNSDLRFRETPQPVFYLKVTILQAARLHHWTCRFPWQSPEFKRKLVQEIFRYVVLALLGALVIYFRSNLAGFSSGTTIRM